jgi:hypothetical protein
LIGGYEADVMQSVHHVYGFSRSEVLRFALPEVLGMLEHGAAPDVEEGVLADLIALHWLRRDGLAWRITAEGEAVVESLGRRTLRQ